MNISREKDARKIDEITFDLESYASGYSGHALIDRLVFCGQICKSLRVDAWKLAIQEILKTTGNVDLYQTLMGKLNIELELQNQQLMDLDVHWISLTANKSLEKTEKLESELNRYKNNLIKESIRMGYNELGDHYYFMGDLTNALKFYSGSRDYLTIPLHIVEMCSKVIQTSMEIGDYNAFQSYSSKLKQVPASSEKTSTLCTASIIQGVIDMENSLFKSAALNFIEIPFDKAEHLWKFVSPRDISIYGCLCVLASFDRSELKLKVMENANFKQFLELEPQMREILRSFYQSRFKDCFNILNRLKNELLLDLFLNFRLESLLIEIRNRAILQYCIPFVSIDMNRMAEVFSCSIVDLEESLSSLIASNQLYARIDSHHKILRSKGDNFRSQILQKTLDEGDEYVQTVQYLKIRSKLIASQICIS